MAGEVASDQVLKGSLYRPPFPTGWTRIPLYSLAKWTNGMAFRDFDFSSFGKPVIKIAEIKNGITPQTKFTNGEYDRDFLVTEGDMLFSWSGQPETSIDVFWWRGPDGWLNQHIFKVLPNVDACFPDFLYYLLKYLNPNFVRIASNKQTTGLGHITRKDLEAIEVALPPRRIQEATACILGRLDDKIELNRRMSQTLEAMAQAIFKSWFMDFEPVCARAAGHHPLGLAAHVAELFPNSFEDSEMGEVPRGWRVHALSALIEINPLRQLSRAAVAPYLDMAAMPMHGHAPDSWIEREVGSGTKFINGDTLLARITPSLENGKTAYVDFLRDGEVGWGSTEYIVLRPLEPIPPVFAYLLARSNEFRTFAIQLMSGSSGRQRVPPDGLANFRFAAPAPDSMVFSAFGQAVNPLFERVRSAMDEIRALAAVRDTLLPRLMSAELRIPDAERIVGRCV
ncbi:MAG: restriction endonuclease subunit S [Symbiobacteriia bacterium]